MANAFAPGLTVSSRQIVRRKRDLPIAGEILVAVGDEVSQEQVVAQAYLEGELRLVRVSEVLGIPPQELHSFLKVAPEQIVQEGQVLAEMRGLWGIFTSTVTAPIAGTVEFISDATGHLGIRAAPRKLDLPAYIAGRVAAVEGARSVVIESEASFVQGIFGVGGERMGAIRLVGSGPGDRIEDSDIPSAAAKLVLVGGHSPSLAALQKAASAGAVGFITGSIDDAVLRDYVGYDIGVAVTGDEAVSMTLIITEGFGSIPMSARVWNTLSAVDGKQASLNGATQVRAGAQRPEVISVASGADLGVDLSSGKGNGGLMIGSKVRMIRVPFFGMTGCVEELPSDPQRIETGASTRVLRARLDDGRSVIVPRANVELL